MASNQEPTTTQSAHPARPGAVVDEVENYDQALKNDLLEALSGIQTSGSFASFGVLPQPPPADLFVHDVGEITLPLSESQARQMIAKARQAPYGKGSATIVDTAVRNTWELDAEQFMLRSPAWPAFLRRVCDRVASDLGINAPITAQIYKMLIYEKGAVFKAHTDTEKIPNMFGTLIICLPSAHQGGEVVVKHCGQKKIFKTSEASQSFACWYSDVSHEVLPVTSGFRWVVTYNLALESTAGPGSSVELQCSGTKALRHILQRWLSEPKESRARKSLYHILDHVYTEASISLKALKTRDLAQVRALKGISNELPVDIFLATLELMEKGNCEPDYYNYRYKPKDNTDHFHPLDDVFESVYTVKTLVDLQGNVVARGMHLDDDDLLEFDCFSSIDPEEEHQGYMGNWGPSATHWYRVTAVVLVPRDSLVSFFRTPIADSEFYSNSLSGRNLNTQIQYLARASLQAQAPKSLFDAMVSLCHKVWKSIDNTSSTLAAKGPLFDGDSTGDMLKAAIQHKNRKFFHEAASRHQGALSLDFFTWLQRWLRHGGHVPYEGFSGLRDGVSSAIQSYPMFAHQCKAIANLVPIVHETSTLPDSNDILDIPPTDVLDWAREQLRFCLEACASKPLCCDDGSAMVDVAKYFHDPAAFISESVAPIIDQREDVAAFRLAFLARLREQTDKNILPMKNAVEFYRARAKSFIDLANFPQMNGLAEVQNALPAKVDRAPSQRKQARNRDRRTAISHEGLADFVSSIIQSSTEAEDLIEPFVSKLAGSARQLAADEFHALWLPFLRALLPVLNTNQIPLDTPYCQELFSALLESYIDGYVGRQPAVDKSLVRARASSCSCQDCESLNAFLDSPTREVGYFTFSKKRRMHLHQQLDKGQVDCTHESQQSGSTRTLVVVKTFWHVEKQRLDWAQRLMVAREQMRTFDEEDLLQVLGHKYVTIVNMEHLSDAAAAAAAAPLLPHERLLQRQPLQMQTIDFASASRSLTAGSKRKAPCSENEIIDLTQD